MDEYLAESGDLPRYILPGDALEYGASLGNANCWVTTRGRGSIQEVFSTAIGKPIAGSITIRYGGAGHPLLRTQMDDVSRDMPDTEVQFRQIDVGEIEIHPAYQRHTFMLPGRLRVRETVFVPMTSADDPAVVYYQIDVTNSGASDRAVRLYAFARLGGSPYPAIVASYDSQVQALIASDRDHPEHVRIFGCTAPVTAYETSRDFGGVYDILHITKLQNEAAITGDILGALQVDLALGPREHRSLTFVLAFAHTGVDDAMDTYRHAQDVEQALVDTLAHLRRITRCAQVLTPQRAINAGALWSKVNMLRVMARYPQGPAFTNEPGISSNVVVRDVAWFVYGNDHFQPAFSRELLDSIARLQYPSGKIPEYYSAIDGRVEDYGLNINDATPLFILAVNHHFRATGDLVWLRGIYPSISAAARYIVTQEDERGLVCCSARDPRGNVWAIAGWRNVIPEYQLNGAVTEINAECVAALRAIGHMAENLNLSQQDSETFFAASDALRTAMDTYLINPRNGLYYLNIDVDGIVHTDVTGDEVFPVMFRACAEETGFRIIKRLFFPDFWTPAGLRTASMDDPLYDPARYVGLLGGVWPGLSWWYAFAAARYHPEIMVRALASSFEHYAANPKGNNTVPGQFSEWFDGASLVNRGMRLSPWEPPRFLWAAVEGVCGVVLQPGPPKVQPLVPVQWRWVGLRCLPYHGAEISFFATREDAGNAAAGFHIYATTEVNSAHDVEVYQEDVTERVRVLHPEVCHLALRRPDKIVLLLGQTSQETSVVPVELSGLLAPDASYTQHLYDSESSTWRQGETGTGTSFSTCTVAIEALGYRILTYSRDQDLT